MIEELISNGITDFDELLNQLSQNDRRNSGLFLLPENLAKLIANLAQRGRPESCINLNSNLGEILRKCTSIKTKIGLNAFSQNT